MPMVVTIASRRHSPGKLTTDPPRRQDAVLLGPSQHDHPPQAHVHRRREEGRRDQQQDALEDEVV